MESTNEFLLYQVYKLCVESIHHHNVTDKNQIDNLMDYIFNIHTEPEQNRLNLCDFDIKNLQDDISALIPKNDIKYLMNKLRDVILTAPKELLIINGLEVPESYLDNSPALSDDEKAIRFSIDYFYNSIWAWFNT